MTCFQMSLAVDGRLHGFRFSRKLERSGNGKRKGG
jgi:hypothetical protein